VRLVATSVKTQDEEYKYAHMTLSAWLEVGGIVIKIIQYVILYKMD
jgi:hypothetical protein